MRSKQNLLVRSNFFTKTNNTIDYVARNTSCSRGWLHIAVQALFGAVTVASFILIIMMSLQKTTQNLRACYITMCKVTCSNTNYNDNDIVAAVMEVEMRCTRIKLDLKDPNFENGTLPSSWLIDLPFSITQLSISGGNLKRIANNAFISTFATKLKSLTLKNIQICEWSPNTSTGLSNLEILNIRNSTIVHIDKNALAPIRDTIQTIVITGSSSWNPMYLTGTNNLTKLTTVNFSTNNFGNILGASSFTGLGFCEYLYLNSCNITAIAPGTFETLNNLKMLFLNDNSLVTIPPGLFYNILNIQHDFKIKINLENNPWHCDCLQSDILELSYNKLLLVDPLCDYPEQLHGTPFSILENYCRNNTETGISESKRVDKIIDFMSLNVCRYGSDVIVERPLRFISPLPQFACHVSEVRNLDRASLINKNLLSDCSWLKSAFVMVHRGFSIMQVDPILNNTGHGFLWYHSGCPNEVYCFNITPNLLRLYNINFDARYTFCPINLHGGTIVTDRCVNYNFSDDFIPHSYVYPRPLLYVGIGLICLFVGAIIVYGIIRTNPYLLKGSKRLLFVKHRSVDALVLPPKVPLRTSLDRQELMSVCDPKIYTVSHDQKLLYADTVMRSNSVRSDKSYSPTYISALQPTEAQLAEWRIRNHFDKNASLISMASDASYECDNNIYDNISYIPYESLK